MSGEWERRTLRWSRTLGGAAAIAALALAAAGGVWAGRAGAPEPPKEAPAWRVVHAGPASVSTPQEWRVVASKPPGTTAVLAPQPGHPGRVIVTVAPAEDGSLIPATLRSLVRAPRQAPRSSSLGGHRAWRYASLPARNPGVVLDVTVVPTTAGVLGVACVLEPRAVIATTGCASSIASVTMSGASTFEPSPDLALRLRLPAVIETLDRERVPARAALRRARTGRLQTRAARRLARAHRAAAGALRPVGGTATSSLVADLTEAAGAYAALGRTASTGPAARYRSARRTLESAESRLAAKIDDFVEPPTEAQAVARPQRPEARPPAEASAGTPTAALAFVVLLSLLAVGLLVRAARAGPHDDVAPDRPHPAVGSQPRGAARWDAPPDELSER